EAAEPVGSSRTVACRGCEMERRRHPLEQALERRAAFAERCLAQITISFTQEIEEHHRSGNLARQRLHPRRGRMESELERLEIESAAARDHDLAVEHAALGQLSGERLDQLGVIACERLLVPTLQVDVVAVAED